MESRALSRGEGPFSSVSSFVSSSVWGGKLAVVASHRKVLYRTVTLERDLRTSGWNNRFLVTVFPAREEPSIVLAVAASLTWTEPALGMAMFLKIGLSTAIKVQKGRWN